MRARGMIGVLVAVVVGCSGGDSSSGGGYLDAGPEAGDGATSEDFDDDGYPRSEDCNDTDPDINPGADEVCNGTDDDCDGRIDLDAVDAPRWYSDEDGDGYGDDGIFTEECEQPPGFVDRGGDCRDGDRAYHPGATEDDCNDPNDYNCDGSVGYEDKDDDGYAACEDCKDDVKAINPGAADLCDFADNDCDAATPDGAAETWYGAACDGNDTDLCEEGTYVCTNGQRVCNDNTTNNRETCDGTDNDCNASTSDGSDEAWLGGACDGPDSDLCAEGSYDCTNGTRVCLDNSGDTFDVCDGADNDCNPNTADGSGDSAVGTPCDGSDADLCQEGAYACVGGSLSCDDSSGDSLDVCDGTDNDCDASTADGSAESWIGGACDGADLDLCQEGTWSCTGGAQSCSDSSGDTPDLCDDSDDDCNPETPDGSGEAWFYQGCDGPDADTCLEGLQGCSSGVQECSDVSGDTTGQCPTFDPGALCPADTTAAVGQALTLQGYGGDPDGGTVSFAWSVTSSPSGSTATPSAAGNAVTGFEPDVAGSYTLELCVTDDEAAQACCTTGITVN